TLLLARDPLGIKPLYVASAPPGFVFASEVRAILASGLVPRAVDRQGIAGFLAYGAVPEPRTFVEGVREFPAGCWQIIHTDILSRGATNGTRRYWRFPAIGAVTTEPDAVAHVRDTLRAAVRDHLVSDVPVGVFLSSG